MSEPDAVPLPREGEVFFDVRGDARTMRLSWYADSAVAVFSIWQGNRCMGTFRLPFADLVRMVETLQSGPPSRPADAISRLSADPSFTNAGDDRGYGYGEPTGYLPAASYGQQLGYESEPGYESASRYGSEPADRSGTGYGAGPDYPDRQSYDHANAHGGPYQGYADQTDYPDYRASHQDQGGVRPARRVAPGAITQAGRQPGASAGQVERMAAPSYRANSSLLDFSPAPASADVEPSDWDAATASYRAP